MQVSSLNSATYARPVSPSVESAWRGRGQAEAAKTSLTPAGVNRKPASDTALPVLPQPRQFTADGQGSYPEKSDLSSRNTDWLQQQQNAGVYSAQIKTSAATTDDALPRRKDATSERRPIPLNRQMAYAAERANRVYQEVAGQQFGRMVDEMV